MPKAQTPDSVSLDEGKASPPSGAYGCVGVVPSLPPRSSFAVVAVGSRWCFALRASLEPGERLLVNHLRNRPPGGGVSCDVSDSANAKGPFLSVARSERSEFVDAAAVCGRARSGLDSRGPVSDLPAMSASTLRIAVSRDKRSFAIANSESGG